MSKIKVGVIGLGVGVGHLQEYVKDERSGTAAVAYREWAAGLPTRSGRAEER